MSAARVTDVVPERRAPLARRFDQRRALGVSAAAVLAGTLLLSFVPLHGPACPFKQTTGLPCPGCGMTRSLMALWHGHVALSLRYHPLGTLVFAACCALVVAALLPERSGLRIVRALTARATLVAACGVMVLFALYRIALVLTGSEYFLWR